MLPMVRLDRLLGLKNSTDAHGFYMAVLEAEGCRYGLVVDDLLAPEEIVVKPVSALLREIGLFSGATVLGNGMLALILDIAATASRAMIKSVPDDDHKKAIATRAEDNEYFLVFEDRPQERTVLPLGLVERIESVAVRQIEYANGKPLLQYRKELLSLRDDSGLIRQMESDCCPNPTVTVLICCNTGSVTEGRIGIVVRQVLDVSRGKALPVEEASRTSVVMVNQKVTSLLRGTDSEIWEEVA